jgi:polyphosphate kinase
LQPDKKNGEEPRFAVIPFGRSLQRFVTLPSDGGYVYMLLEDMVRLYVERFFPGEPILECVPFRITRNADLGVQEDQASDLLAEIEEVLVARKESACVRLEISDRVTTNMLSFLKSTLGLEEHDVYAVPGPLDLSALWRLTEESGFDRLRSLPWPPRPSPLIDASKSLFETITERDVLLYHPYESFEPVIRLIEEAAADPDVLAIKQTLYRTSRNSPVVAALIHAAEQGKYVTAIIELKARFDEARNIEGAKNLERAGAQVLYGVKGFKTHAKICVIIRREPQGIVRYMHFGTGNYNESTARLYSDVSLMTCDPDLGSDATNFFNAVTGYSQPQRFRKIEAAPIALRDRLIDMIEAETERKKQGQKARITAKLNSLVDPRIIEALYEASDAGVKIRLNIRGICCLRPGVPNLSENISVVSIVDRFLEHARIVAFHHGGDVRVFISSADWMPRNLDRRVELLTPVEDPMHRDRLIEILDLYFSDNVKAHVLQTDGSYRRTKRKKNQKAVRAQEVLYQEACAAVEEAEKSRRTAFEPHRAPENGQ